MKGTMKRMARSAIALLLSVSMVFGMSSTAFATGINEETAGSPESDPGTINYVSLGDSMTNGYGLDGYNANTGTEDYGYESYANKFAEELHAKHHAQLAMSAMRAEDLHWLLEVDYDDEKVIDLINDFDVNGWNEERWYSVFTTGDYWTWKELVHNYRFDIAAAYIEKLDYNCITDNSKMTDDEKDSIYDHYSDIKALTVVAKYYQESVADADVISLGIGNGNFGVFMFGRIMEAIGFEGTPDEAMVYDVNKAIQECDPELQEQLKTLLKEVETILAENGFVVDDGKEEVSTMEALYNTLVYATISYALNYAGTVEAILQSNSDVDIIQVALMNTVKSNGESTEEKTLGKALDLLYKPLNVYIAALPTCMQAAENSVYADASFYYAEAPYVECIVDTYSEDGLDEIVRDRFHQSIVKDEDDDAGMVWKLLDGKVVDVTLDEIEAYEGKSTSEKIEYITSYATKATSVAMYLAFEKAIIKGKNNSVSIDAVMGLSDLFAEESDPFGAIMEEFEAKVVITEDSNEEIVNAIAAVIADSANMSVDDVKAAMLAGNVNILEKATPLYKLLVMPEVLGDVIANSELSGLLALFARCVIGNGIGSHPSTTGHEALFTAVKDAYKNHTAKDQTIANLQETAQAVAALVAEYYDEAYAYAYAEAKEAGYIDEAVDAIDAAIAEISKLDAKALGLSAELTAELESAVRNAVDTLEALKELILEADVLDDDTLAAAEKLLGELGQNMTDIREVLTQAGKEAGEAAWVAYEEALKIFNEEIKPVIIEKLKEAVAAGTEWLYNKVEEAYAEFLEALKAAMKEAVEAIPELEEIDQFIYDWLYNNPDKVIGFFNEYGDEIVEFIVDNHEAIFAVLGYLASEYGDDVVRYILENPEEVLEALIKIYNEHGEEAGAIIKVYLEELGVFDALEELGGYIEEIYEALEKYASEKLEDAYNKLKDAAVAQLEKALEELNAYVEREIEKLENYVKAELEKAIAELEAELAKLEAALENAKGEVKAKIEAAIAEIEAAIAELKAQIEDIEATIKALQNAIEAADKAVKEFLEAVNTDMKSAIAAIEKFLADIEAAVEEIEDCAEEVKAIITEAIAITKEVIKVVEAISEYMPEAIETLEKIVAAVKEIKAVLDELNIDLNTLCAMVKDVVEMAYENATNGVYIMSEDSKYVAIGDASLADSEAYSDKLAEELDVDHVELSDFDTAAELRANLADKDSYVENIKEADLITLNFSNVALTTEALDNIEKADWVKYVGEEGLKYIEKVLAAMNEKFVEEGMADNADRLTDFVEAYAYSYTELACNYTEVVNQIKAINEDAQIVLVGMYNPFDNVVIPTGDGSMELGEYVDTLVALCNAHFTAYAMYTRGDVIYVDAPEVEVANPFVLDETTDVMALVKYFANLDENLAPNAAGHEYIKDQILDALLVLDPATGDVFYKIMALLDIEDINEDNLAEVKALVAAAREAYDKLNDEQKAKLGVRVESVLTRYEAWVAQVEGDVDQINKLEDELTELERVLKVTKSSTASAKVTNNKTTVKATWKKVDGADRYQVVLYRNGKKYSTKYTSNLSFSWKGQARGVYYKVKVTPYAKHGGKNYYGVAKTSKAKYVTLKHTTPKLTVKKSGRYQKLTAGDMNSTGYQVRVATNKKFTKGVKTYKFKTSYGSLNKKLKTSKYFSGNRKYVKVRAYTTINGKTYYGNWSSVKTVKK